MRTKERPLWSKRLQDCNADPSTPPARRLNPVFTIDGKDHAVVTQFISALTASELEEAEGNLAPHHDQIVAAIDMLLQGF